MTWTPRTLPTLDERERAAYADGDTATAALCVQAIEGDMDARQEVGTLAEENSLLSNDLTDTNVRIMAANDLLDTWPEECLLAITRYVETAFEDDPVRRELLDLIRQTECDLLDRITALRNALC